MLCENLNINHNIFASPINLMYFRIYLSGKNTFYRTCSWEKIPQIFSRILIQRIERLSSWLAKKERKIILNWRILRQQGIQRKGQQTRFVDPISLLG